MIESHLAKESTIAFQLTAVAYCLRQLCPEVSFVFQLSSLISVNHFKKWRREKFPRVHGQRGGEDAEVRIPVDKYWQILANNGKYWQILVSCL